MKHAKEVAKEIVTARLEGRRVSFLQIFRDDIVEYAVRKARPIPVFRAFYMSAVREAALALEVDTYPKSEPFRLLEMWNYIGYFSIPKEIRRRIPELIREALKAGGK